MAPQQSPIYTPNTAETASESNEQGLTSAESVTAKFPEDRLSEKEKRDPETSPAIPMGGVGVDEYPDGGFAAWCVVLGVSKSTSPDLLRPLMNLNYVVFVCRFRDVGCTFRAEP